MPQLPWRVAEPRTHIFLEITSTYRKHHDPIRRLKPAPLQLFDKDRAQPSSFGLAVSSDTSAQRSRVRDWTSPDFDELITNPVEMSQTGFHDRFAICPRQNAASVTQVEPAIYQWVNRSSYWRC